MEYARYAPADSETQDQLVSQFQQEQEILEAASSGGGAKKKKKQKKIWNKIDSCNLHCMYVLHCAFAYCDYHWKYS